MRVQVCPWIRIRHGRAYRRGTSRGGLPGPRYGLGNRDARQSQRESEPVGVDSAVC
jgi:hypothetical protein